MHSTFLEILISATISMGMLKHWEWLQNQDHFSMYCMFFFSTLLASYVLFLLYFGICKARKLAARSAAARDNRFLTKLEKMHSNILEQIDIKGKNLEE